jgi:hypothetical protein
VDPLAAVPTPKPSCGWRKPVAGSGCGKNGFTKADGDETVDARNASKGTAVEAAPGGAVKVGNVELGVGHDAVVDVNGLNVDGANENGAAAVEEEADPDPSSVANGSTCGFTAIVEGGSVAARAGEFVVVRWPNGHVVMG